MLLRRIAELEQANASLEQALLAVIQPGVSPVTATQTAADSQGSKCIKTDGPAGCACIIPALPAGGTEQAGPCSAEPTQFVGRGAEDESHKHEASTAAVAPAGGPKDEQQGLAHQTAAAQQGAAAQDVEARLAEAHRRVDALQETCEKQIRALTDADGRLADLTQQLADVSLQLRAAQAVAEAAKREAAQTEQRCRCGIRTNRAEQRAVLWSGMLDRWQGSDGCQACGRLQYGSFCNGFLQRMRRDRIASAAKDAEERGRVGSEGELHATHATIAAQFAEVDTLRTANDAWEAECAKLRAELTELQNRSGPGHVKRNSRS